jgi:hypothetical protein
LRVELAVERHKVKVDRVDRDPHLAREVLLRACQERLREEEAGQPEAHGLAVVDPLLEEGEPRVHLAHVRAERLERGEGALEPRGGHLAIEERGADGVERGRHQREAAHRLAEVAERCPDLHTGLRHVLHRLARALRQLASAACAMQRLRAMRTQSLHQASR